MNVTFVPLFVILALVVGISIFRWRMRRAEQMRTEWADSQGYEVVSAHFCWFWRGPFTWWSSDSQIVHRIVVHTAEGETREGWLRSGGWFLGMLTDRVDVRWKG